MRENRRALLSTLLIFVIRIYRNLFSHMMFSSCRFLPTCSEYAILAIRRHGAWRGLAQASLRLLRCHPFGGQGLDPVR